jgi:hypothetical protein
LETAGSVLNYFEPFLGRIEILGGGKRIERVYFEIKESNIEQWEKPQIKVKSVCLIYLFVVCLLGFIYIYSFLSSGYKGALLSGKNLPEPESITSSSSPPYILMVCC